MRCTDCPYCWKGEDDRFPCCHFEGPDGWAPCEQDDDYETPDYDEED